MCTTLPVVHVYSECAINGSDYIIMAAFSHMYVSSFILDDQLCNGKWMSTLSDTIQSLTIFVCIG